MDPIFQSLTAELKAAKAALETNRKEVEEMKKGVEELGARDKNRNRTLREYAQKVKQGERLAQQVVYKELYLEKRRLYARASYTKAYQRDQPWPDPKENQEYIVYKRLNEAPRNWDARVPRLHKDAATLAAEAKAKKAPPAAGGH